MTVLLKPQPPKSDPVWTGNTTGAIYQKTCDIGGIHPGTTVLWAPEPPDDAEPTVTPAQLAQEALASLQLPKPVLRRSPMESNSDGGTPYTWVNLWTWYWTSPATWRELPKTASLGSVWATVTATPTKLTFTPGDGSAPVSCAGPGRSWAKADGNKAPSKGGCAYRYRSVRDQVAPTLTIHWDVSWTGSGGENELLPAMTTQTISTPFAVQQIQTVNR